MDSRVEESRARCEAEEAGIAPEISAAFPCPLSHGATAEAKAARLSPSFPSTSSPKRSRRSVQKRVVSVPIAEADATRPKGSGEGAPPSDSWAWRKYGQKPIKGSPYPRGYYRCSSSKGCPARKQVERSREDPTMLVITYACEHNHPWPLPKNHHNNQHHSSISPTNPTPKPAPEEHVQLQTSPPDPFDPDEKFSDLIADEPSLMMPYDFEWFSDVGSPSSAPPPAARKTLLCTPIYDAAMLCADEWEKLGTAKDEEDSLFAGLGELPEFSMVFRRGLAAASTG